MPTAAGPSLKVVSTNSAGHDHIDLALLARHGVAVGTGPFLLSPPILQETLIASTMRRAVPDALTDACADTGAMLVLMASRRAGEVRISSDLSQ
jgi:glyoxylate/hydroxypyruvate reductase